MSLLHRVLAEARTPEPKRRRPRKHLSESTSLLQSKLRFVTFRHPLGETRDFSVVAPTEKSAVQRAKLTHHIESPWVAVAVDNRPIQDQS